MWIFNDLRYTIKSLFYDGLLMLRYWGTHIVFAWYFSFLNINNFNICQDPVWHCSSSGSEFLKCSTIAKLSRRNPKTFDNQPVESIWWSYKFRKIELSPQTAGNDELARPPRHITGALWRASGEQGCGFFEPTGSWQTIYQFTFPYVLPYVTNTLPPRGWLLQQFMHHGIQDSAHWLWIRRTKRVEKSPLAWSKIPQGRGDLG